MKRTFHKDLYKNVVSLEEVSGKAAAWAPWRWLKIPVLQDFRFGGSFSM